MQKDEATVDAYLRILRQFTAWVTKLPGQGGQFVPSQLTTTAVERYLSVLKEQGYSVSHRTRVKTVINGFCQWLIEEKQALTRNPTRGVEIKAQQVLAPRILSPDQRFVLCQLLEKAGDLRGKAIFAGKGQCSKCHRREALDDDRPHDIGTTWPGDVQSAFDTPSLRGLPRTSPYLHHGQAATLEEVFTKFHHKVGPGLSMVELADLLRFLRSL